MWKNIVEPDKPEVKVWCMHIAFGIPKATNTHLQYVTLILFPQQQMVARTRLNVTLYIQRLAC